MSSPLNLACIEVDGILTISSVALHTPGWAVLDVTPLWNPADQRGQDLLIPGLSGVYPLRRRVTVSERSLRMIISGYHDKDGNAYSDPRLGLFENINYLNTNVVQPIGGNGLRTAVLTAPAGDAAYMTGSVHVLGLEIGDQVAGVAKAVLRVSIPSGRLSVVG